MRILFKPHAFAFLFVPSVFSSIAFADLSYSTDLSSYMPRTYIQGFVGTAYEEQADVVAPVFLRPDKNLFVYAQGRYGNEMESWADNPWTASLGLGYRQIVSDSAVLGAYVLGDYTNTPQNHHFGQISPGVEALGRIWEFRANGYLPLGKKDWTESDFADRFGNNHYTYFQGHTQYDAIFTYHEETGPGADAEIGRKLFTANNVVVKGYVGGYYFDMQHNDNVLGGGARITFQKSRSVKLSIKDIYDNYEHNTFMVGFQLSLYDLFSKNRSDVMDNNNLQPKLFDPIERNMGELAYGSDVRVVNGPHATRGQSNTTAEAKPQITPGVEEQQNVWFFVPDNGKTDPNQDGSFEHPFIGLTQDEIYQIPASADSRAWLYFAQGSYNAVGPVVDDYAGLRVDPYKELYGRMAVGYDPFAAPAIGDNRPIFNGGLALASHAALNNLIFHATPNVPEGIVLDNAQDVVIRATDIGVDPDAQGFDPNLAYEVGIDMLNNSAVTLDQSNVYGYIGYPGTIAAGIMVANGGSITAINYSKVVGKGVDEGVGIQLISSPCNHNLIIGDITGDKTSTFVGEGDDGYGFMADEDIAQNVFIGNIKGVNFKGIAYGNVDYNAGFRVQSNFRSNTSITIGNISDSTFIGSSSVGMLLQSPNFIKVGNITNSTFQGPKEGIVFRSNIVAIDSIAGSTFKGDDASIFVPTGLYVNSLHLSAEDLYKQYLQPNGNLVQGLISVDDTYYTPKI